MWGHWGPAWAQLGPTWAGMGPHGPNMSSCWAHVGPSRPKLAQVGPKLAPSGPTLGSSWAQLAPSWAQSCLKCPQVGPKWSQVESKLAQLNLDPTWPEVGPDPALGAFLAAPNSAFVERRQYSVFYMFVFFDVLGLLGGSWTGLSGSWAVSYTHLRAHETDS